MHHSILLLSMKLVLTLCFLFHVHAHSWNQSVRKLSHAESREEAANKKARKRDAQYYGLKNLVELTFGLNFDYAQSLYNATHETMWWKLNCKYEEFKKQWTKWPEDSAQYKAYNDVYDVAVKLGKGEMSMATAKKTLIAMWLKLSPNVREQLRDSSDGFRLIDEGEL
ncbi:hypothetical protein GCK32_004610 [Trichostrongylus colubriformis]|uniref:Uncharacterized protein n=1 Tax=Trichostrongylus colubriformis TaxID=6319 RepID=A0AAN8FCZ3_TRICO